MKRVLQFIVRAAVVLAAFLIIPAAAGAQDRSWAYTFNPTPPSPSFQPETQLPLITFTASYDNTAGTLTVSESGGDPSYNSGWQQDQISFWQSGTDLDSSPTGTVGPPGTQYGTAPPSFGPVTINGINGSLAGTTTVNGGTITATYSSPLIANLNWTMVSVGGAGGNDYDNSCGCDEGVDVSAYFPGYSPTINVGAGNETIKLGTAIDQALSPTLNGLSDIDLTDPSDVTITSATDLPPGLNLESVGEGSVYIEGSATWPGTYHVTFYAQAADLTLQQTITGSQTLVWTVPTPTVGIPNNEGTRRLSVRPKYIINSGDGTSIIGGGIGRIKGRIRWSSWNYTSGATGRGTNWIDNCNPDCAGGSYTGYPVKIHLYRPALEAGRWVFSRMTVTFPHKRPRWITRSYTAQVGVSDGYYYLN